MNYSSSTFYVVGSVALLTLLAFAWRMASGAGYESAEYSVVSTDGKIEVRDYPELTIARTAMKSYGKGSDGSFMRLFRYISGENNAKQKIAMTTPVFMEASNEERAGQMAFVLPKEVAAKSPPDPTSEAVGVEKRAPGKYAVIRFTGRMDEESISKAETKLRDWMEANDLVGSDAAEFAGSDPPWTPGPLRRNEVLIRIK